MKYENNYMKRMKRFLMFKLQHQRGVKPLLVRCTEICWLMKIKQKLLKWYMYIKLYEIQINAAKQL